jgi:hypothetical protein
MHSDLAAEVAVVALPQAPQLTVVSAASERPYLLELVARVVGDGGVLQKRRRLGYNADVEFIIALQAAVELGVRAKPKGGHAARGGV